jgi:hypothetical protein
MLLGGGCCCLMAMQNCWSPANCAWMVDMLLAWLLTVSYVAAYTVPKFARDLPYDAMEPPFSSMAAMP